MKSKNFSNNLLPIEVEVTTNDYGVNAILMYDNDVSLDLISVEEAKELVKFLLDAIYYLEN